ncbi:MAG: hypothetical protein BGP25_05300 [Lysobacterales bacterium 63-13]|nr:MAG: hypothetical protein BGP25_05300 [Xanthomonadales bacterium 63-13]
MSHQTWIRERNDRKGVRYIVKLWPIGPHKRLGMRYRMLRGEWHNSGLEERDAYLSYLGLQRRVKELEDDFLTANAGDKP